MNAHFIDNGVDPMRASEAIKSLVGAGFTKQQALGLASAMISIRSGEFERADVEMNLEKQGFAPETAGKLVDVFYQVLAAA